MAVVGERESDSGGGGGGKTAAAQSGAAVAAAQAAVLALDLAGSFPGSIAVGIISLQWNSVERSKCHAMPLAILIVYTGTYFVRT